MTLVPLVTGSPSACSALAWLSHSSCSLSSHLRYTTKSRHGLLMVAARSSTSAMNSLASTTQSSLVRLRCASAPPPLVELSLLPPPCDAWRSSGASAAPKVHRRSARERSARSVRLRSPLLPAPMLPAALLVAAAGGGGEGGPSAWRMDSDPWKARRIDAGDSAWCLAAKSCSLVTVLKWNLGSLCSTARTNTCGQV